MNELSLSLDLELTRLDTGPFEAAAASKLVSMLESNGLFQNLLKVSVRLGDLKKTVTPRECAAIVASMPNPAEVILSAPNIDDFSGTLVLKSARCSFNLYLSTDYIKQNGGSLHEKLVTIARETAVLAACFRADYSTGVYVRGLNFPNLRSPTVPIIARRSASIDILDERTPKTEEERKAISHFRSSALPEGVRRYLEGSVIVIDWLGGGSLDDADALRSRLLTRYRWLTQYSGARLEPIWNAKGDVKHGFIGGVPHSALTLFNPALGVGYKALHSAQPAHEIEATLQKVGQWIKDGRVDEQTEVSDVLIIADSRETALALKPHLDKYAIKHIVYPDEEDHFWNPFPKGEWIDKK